MNKAKLRKRLISLVSQSVITADDMVDLSTSYPSFTAFDDHYTIMTPNDRRNVLNRLLGTLNDDSGVAANEHVTSILNFTKNISPVPVSRMNQIKSDQAELNTYQQRIKANGAVKFEEEELYLMPGTLRKYAGLDYTGIITDIIKVNRIMLKLFSLLLPVLEGTNTKRLHEKYLTAIKNMEIEHSISHDIVPASSTIIFIGAFNLIFIDENNIPVTRSLIFPNRKDILFPIAKPSDIVNINDKITTAHESLLNFYESREAIVNITNRAMLAIKIDPTIVEVDHGDYCRQLLSALNTTNNVHNYMAITLGEIVEFFNVSLKFRYSNK